MWDKLTGSVETLVAKVALMQPDVAAPPAEEDTEASPLAKPLPPAGHCPEGRGRPHSASRSRADVPPHSLRSRSLDRPAPRPALLPEKADTLRPTFTSSTGLEPILSTSRLDGGRSTMSPWKWPLPGPAAEANMPGGRTQLLAGCRVTTPLASPNSSAW